MASMKHFWVFSKLIQTVAPSNKQFIHFFKLIFQVTKVGREIYRWNGTGHLTKTLTFLKVISEKMQVIEKLHNTKEQKSKTLFEEGKVQNELLNQVSLNLNLTFVRFS